MIRRGSVTEENGVQTMRLDMIRSTSDDVVQISHQTGIPEWKIQKIKELKLPTSKMGFAP
jgi:hypothetical protein